MNAMNVLRFWFVVMAVGAMHLIASTPTSVIAEEIHVDATNGNDANPGTKEKPLQTLARAAALVNSRTEAGPTVVKIAPGIYALSKRVVFENTRAYTKDNRLLIEATILPDDPEWKPALMPVVLSTEQPPQPEKPDERGTLTYGFKIEVSHVTIRGLKFLGSPAVHNRYYPIRRDGNKLEDLLVTQCLFVGDRHASPIHVAIIARGHGLVVDHSIFYNCKNSVVFWTAEGGTSRGNAMTYCIVDGGYRTGVWVTDTAEDFDFHHNVITRCEYFFMREAKNRRTYRLHDCIVTNNKYYSGYGSAGGPAGVTDSEIAYDESNIVKAGEVILETDRVRPAELSADLPRNYLHVAPGSLGSALGAGLFKK